MFIKTFKKSFKSFLAHARTPPRGWRRSALAIPVGEYECGQNKSSDRPVCRSGYNSDLCIAGIDQMLEISMSR